MSLSVQNQSNKVVSLDFSEDKVQLLKNTVCKGASNDELELFLHVCNRTGLDPFRNQIYAIKRGSKMTIQTGIDGFRLIAERTGKYAPGKEPTFVYDSQGKLKSATSYIKKQTTDGTWHDISAPAFWSEYVQEYNGKPSQFWSKMPHTMLAKVAEALALRKAFPADFSGLYSTEEMAQADNEKSQELVVEKQPEIIPEEDFTEEEVESYLDKNWGAEKENFKIFMDEMMTSKGWNYRKCINMFEKHKEHTSQTFLGWLSVKVGL